MRYVDDTLLLVKNEDVQHVLNSLNNFDENLNFTVDEFHSNVHFLDILIDKNKTDVFYKETNTGQYTHFSSFTPWRLKVSWVNALFIRAKKICSDEQMFLKQVKYIKKLLSWNGFPKYVANKIIKNLIDKYKDYVVSNVNDENVENVNEIFVRLPYCGDTGERLMSKCISRINRELKVKVKYKILYNTCKISNFCCVKDAIPKGQKNNVIYQIKCPGCNEVYIGKTNCCVEKRMHEHAEKPDQPMYLHLKSCECFQQSVDMFNLPDIDSRCEPILPQSHYVSAVLDNYSIIKTNHNSAHLALCETYFIRKNKPKLNEGLKACVDFKVFNF